MTTAPPDPAAGQPSTLSHRMKSAGHAALRPVNRVATMTARAAAGAGAGIARAAQGRLTRRRAVTGAAGAAALTMLLMVVTVSAPAGNTPPPQWLDTRHAAAFDPPVSMPVAPGPAAPMPQQTVRALAAPIETSPEPAGPGEQAGSPSSGPGSGPGSDSGEFTSWAIMDTTTGNITGSPNLAETSTTASMIKVWLAADYLRRTAEQGEEPPQDRLDELTLIVRDSNNEHTQELFVELGHHASIERLISICGLTDSYPIPYFWSNTQLSPRDTARMGACIARGDAAGPEWTDWLLDEMRAVRGIGDFGIRHALPAGERSSVAIKNGWVIRSAEGEYHVNCLAIGNGWTMGVMTRYPAEWGYLHGAEICRSLAAEHLM